MTEFISIHFYDNLIEVVFDVQPAREKTPDCPNGFVWNDRTYLVAEMLSSWSDFSRRGRSAAICGLPMRKLQVLKAR